MQKWCLQILDTLITNYNWSIFAAKMKSLSANPLIVCVKILTLA